MFCSLRDVLRGSVAWITDWTCPRLQSCPSGGRSGRLSFISQLEFTITLSLYLFRAVQNWLKSYKREISLSSRNTWRDFRLYIRSMLTSERNSSKYLFYNYQWIEINLQKEQNKSIFSTACARNWFVEFGWTSKVRFFLLNYCLKVRLY
jgi:hypothetical protein